MLSPIGGFPNTVVVGDCRQSSGRPSATLLFEMSRPSSPARIELFLARAVSSLFSLGYPHARPPSLYTPPQTTMPAVPQTTVSPLPSCARLDHCQPPSHARRARACVAAAPPPPAARWRPPFAFLRAVFFVISPSRGWWVCALLCAAQSPVEQFKTACSNPMETVNGLGQSIEASIKGTKLEGAANTVSEKANAPAGLIVLSLGALLCLLLLLAMPTLRCRHARHEVTATHFLNLYLFTFYKSYVLVLQKPTAPSYSAFAPEACGSANAEQRCVSLAHAQCAGQRRDPPRRG